MLKINSNVGPICLINMESSCKRKKKNVTYCGKTVDLPAGIGPQIQYNILSYIVYCRVSRSLRRQR